MARSAITDMLQVYRFWLLDITPLDSLSLPIFNPLLGFSEITAPEITSEIINIPEGNWYFQKKVIGRAQVSPITLKRGTSVFDRDFYNWIMHSITGESPKALYKAASAVVGNANKVGINPTPRRNLLLVQYFTRNPLERLGKQVVLQNNSPGNLFVDQSSFSSKRIEDIPGLFSFGPPGLIDFVPARLFVLYGCVPSRYKTSQDFNAKGSDVSVQELTIECEGFEQVTMA